MLGTFPTFCCKQCCNHICHLVTEHVFQLDKFPEVGLLIQRVYAFITLLVLPNRSSKIFVTSYVLTGNERVSTQLHSQNVLLIFKLFYPSGRWKMVSRYCFNLIICYVVSSFTSFLYFRKSFMFLLWTFYSYLLLIFELLGFFSLFPKPLYS